MNKTSTSSLLPVSDTAKLCVRWKWKRKAITWCTSLAWKAEACAYRVSFTHAAADCQQNVKGSWNADARMRGLPTCSTFPGWMLYLWITSSFLYLHFRPYRWQPHPRWFIMSCHTKPGGNKRWRSGTWEQRHDCTDCLCRAVETLQHHLWQWLMLLWNLNPNLLLFNDIHKTSTRFILQDGGLIRACASEVVD